MADINHSKGVEVNDIDRITEDNIYDVAAFAEAFAKKTGAVLCITGVIDIVTDGNVVYCIRNGHPMMSRVTGSGCQLSFNNLLMQLSVWKMCIQALHMWIKQMQIKQICA